MRLHKQIPRTQATLVRDKQHETEDPDNSEHDDRHIDSGVLERGLVPAAA
jgi:hypothetical protein